MTKTIHWWSISLKQLVGFPEKSTQWRRLGTTISRNAHFNFREHEGDLERKFNLLQKELRTMMEIQDESKTDAQREQEQALIEELLEIVNERDRLVQDLDEQEKW